MEQTRSTSPELPVPAYDKAGEAVGRTTLSGNLGVLGLLFQVLAFNAPLAIVVGFVPIIIGAGTGLGAPVALLTACAIVALFSVGFTAMGRHLPNPGAFYSYITAGLGRPMGLGSSFLAIYFYFFMLLGSYAFLGIAVESLVRDTFGGPDVAWWIWASLAQVVVGTLGYLSIDLSGRVLAVLLGCEIAMVLVYDALVVIRGGPEGYSVRDSFSIESATSGSVGLALLFSIMVFLGIEATAVFREEVRDPDRTIPRATYLTVAFVGLMYAFGAWVVIQAIGPSKVVAATASDPTGAFTQSVEAYVGRGGVDIVTVLLCTSIFAATLASHNLSTRYLYSLSVDRIFPASLAGVHHRHGSPHTSSLAVSGLAFLFVTGLVVFKGDPGTLYATLVGIAAYAFILLLLLTSVAVMVYFNTRRGDVSPWHRVMAPALSIIGLSVSLVLATQNLALLVGGSQSLANAMLVATYSTFALGAVLAFAYRRTRPDAYARIGRQQP